MKTPPLSPGQRIFKRMGLLIFLCIFISTHLALFANAQITTEKYIISPDIIVEQREPGDLIHRTLTISNTGPNRMTITAELSPELLPFVDLDREAIVIDPGVQEPLQLQIYLGEDTGSTNGTLTLSGDIQETIPIILEAGYGKDSAVGTLMIELHLLDQNIYSGSKLNYIIDLRNLNAEREYNLTLFHEIEPLDNKSQSNIRGIQLWNTSETIEMKNTKSLVREFSIPKDFDIGDYALTIHATYLNYTSVVKGLFIVDRPVQDKRVAGIIPVWSLATIIATGLVGYFVYLYIKKLKEKNKRFHAKVDYKLIPKEGERNIFIGYIAETKHKAYLDMDNLTVHSIVAGSTGGGKSIAAQDIIEECLLKGTAVCVFDPTAQWSGMLRKLQDKKFLSFYPNFGMDPKKDPTAFPGNIKAIKDYREIVDIFKYMKEGQIQVFTTNTLDPKNYDIFVANMIRQIFHSKLEEFRGLKYLVVFDEIHRILPKFGGSGAGFLQIERGCREFRKWGIGIVLISQVLSDFVGEIKANINTLVQMKTRDEGDLNRIKMQYGEEFIQALVKAPVGSGMIQNAAYNGGNPFYVTFRPILHSVKRLTDEELDQYNQWNSVVEDLEYQLQQLETEHKQDVFDLKLELKLASDKIKSGNFNMVKIYLDGLTPRITKIWTKIAKTPKKLEIKLVDEKELQEDLEKAKAAKAKQQDAQKSGGA